MPWWGWAIIAFFVLNVVFQRNVGFFVPVIIGMVAAGMLGQRRGPAQKGQDQPRPLPSSPPPGPTAEQAPGDSPWVHRPPTGSAPGQAGSGTGMPRIEVPQYPHGATPPSAYPSSGASPSTDPVVSLGQLHLSRCARDLHAAATAGSSVDVARVLDEVRDQTDRLLAQLSGAGAMPGSGRREFEAGLRRLQRDVAAASGEDPPGAKVGRVVQGAGAIGQTGRYE